MDAKIFHLKKVLVANRGEIAVRCIQACKKLGIKSVSIYTTSDSNSTHASLADENVLLSGENAGGYLETEEIIGICKRLDVDAVIPGYGFLSENAEFAERIIEEGMVFVGPSSASMTEMGQKHRARELAISADVPVVPGTDLLTTGDEAKTAANKLGFPVILKATAGGGGMGLIVCQNEEEVTVGFAKVTSRGETLFKNSGVFLEKYFPESRHVEVQVFGTGACVVDFGERECSIQRRHQKVIEECPSPFVAQRPGMREKLTKCAVAYASKLNYKSTGTAEFLVDDITGQFFFLEMNTRLQVEHGITELCYDVDLVALMLQQADYEKRGEIGMPKDMLLKSKNSLNGAAIEVRVYAEVPYRNYAPSSGLLQAVKWPEGDGIRVDTWVKSGQRIAPYYDPLIAKIMVHDIDRPAAALKMKRVLRESTLQGPATNIHFLHSVISSKNFLSGQTLTNFLDKKFKYQPCAIDVISPGAFTTVQDYPARATAGHGIPKGGPMDNISSRLANILVGNHPGTETLEFTVSGPELVFTAPAIISLCGAPMPITIDGEDRPMWSTLLIKSGQRLSIEKVEEAGCRAYLAVKGGFPQIGLYLGSKGATPSLGFGGTQGRQLQMGDFIELNEKTLNWADKFNEIYTLPSACIPDYNVGEVYCMHGPHDSDDFMTQEDREMLYGTRWKIGHNSNRTGIRLVGPVPKWARKDGGEGGSHPSNVFDYGYPSPGGINWGGDSPVIFSMDSPDLGGLICSTTIISGDLWRVGQVKPGGTLKLTSTTYENAIELSKRIEIFILDVEALVTGQSKEVPTLDLVLPPSNIPAGTSNAILKTRKRADGTPTQLDVTYRQGGDNFVLVEFGEQIVDIIATARVRQLVEKLKELSITNMIFNPNVGTVMIQFDSKFITQQKLLEVVDEIESSIEGTTDVKIPCREIKLPVVFDHPDLREAEKRYMETARPSAAYLPDNIEYVRKNNGLSSRREVFETMLNSPFLVTASGFLVGTPILFPLEQRSLICAQKYNPTRVSTPGGTIGMGGSLWAIYTLEAPGGYMMLARTMEGWDTFGLKPNFSPEKPWLYETFDLVRYHEVSIEEYDKLMSQFRSGQYHFDIREGVFDLQEVYDKLQASKADAEIIKFKEGQKSGMAEQLAIEQRLYGEWVAEQEAVKNAEAERLKGLVEIGKGEEAPITIDSPIDANVWKVLVKPGDVLKEGQIIAILEAMKMEINILCTKEAVGCKVKAIASKPGTVVSPGAWLVVGQLDTSGSD